MTRTLILAGGFLVALFVLAMALQAHAYTGLQWTMPTTNAKPVDATHPLGCDSTGTAIPATEYSRWWIYRTAPAAPLVPVDSLAFGTALPGASVTRNWNQMKPVPIPGSWCFVVLVGDSLGNRCPAKFATPATAFTALDLEAPKPLSLIGRMP